jgi:DNA ligase (NAD+)
MFRKIQKRADDILRNNQAEIQKIVGELSLYNQAYRKIPSAPLVSDEYYDALTERLRELDTDNLYLQEVEPEPENFEGKAKVKHVVPMLSTEKGYTAEALSKFLTRVQREANDIGITEEIQFRVTPKLDGIAGKDDGITLSTRGDGLKGFDITDIFDKGVVSVGGRKPGVGEIVLKDSYFKEFLSERFEHPRSACGGIISADIVNPDAQIALDEEVVHFVRYEELPRWVGKAAVLFKNIKEITEHLKSAVDYRLDGMVIEAIDEDLRQHMGATSHHNRWQFAVKTKGEMAQVPILDIIWQVGRTGVHTPVLIIPETSLSGSNIKRVTAHHAGKIKDLNIGVGSIIEIIRAGEVIPKLERVIEAKGTPEIPTVCEACGAELFWEKNVAGEANFLKCNNLDCSAQFERTIHHWFKTLNNSDGFGPKTIKTISDSGVNTIEKVYALKTEDFIQMGFGPQQSKNLSDSLRISQNTQIEDWRFLASFGIPNLGRGDSRNLLQHITLDELIRLDDPEEISAIKGFGEITSNSIVDYLQMNRSKIEHMYNSVGFNLESTPLLSEMEEVDSPIAGKGIVFTGKMEQGNRGDMEEHARALGATVQKAVTKKTDMLVCGAKVGAKKTGKANDLGVQIISEDDYLDFISDDLDSGPRM